MNPCLLTGIRCAGALCLSTLSNLWSGVKLILLLPCRRADFTASAAHLWCIAAILLATYFVMDFNFAERPAVFSFYALSEKAFWFALVLLSGLFASLLARRQSVHWSFPVVFLNALWVPIILHGCALKWLNYDSREDYNTYHNLMYLAYFVIAFRSLMVVMPQNALRQLWGALAAVGMCYAASASGYFYYSSFWYKDYKEDEARDAQPAYMAEDALSDQSALLADHLAKVEPRKKGKNHFVITFGSDDAQDVFKKEALFARGVLGKKFHAENRVLTLINHPTMLAEFPYASVTGLGRMLEFMAHKAAEKSGKKPEVKDRYPLATTTNLAQALETVGRKADPKEDVLVLYLTSHGGSNSTMSVNLADLGLRQLTAEHLRKMLDKSGFTWKVLLISACYSGSFIDKLKDDTSIIITSSREDRVSYGCGKDDDLTYFGRALLQHALPKTDSFIEAYELARENVQHQEEDSFIRKHSQPQIYVGRRVRDYLK